MSHWRKKILIVSLLLFFGLVLSPLALAEDSSSVEAPELQVAIGDSVVKLDTISCTETSCSIDWISEYVAAIYKYGVGVAAILAVVMIMIGGFVWLTSAGVPERIGKAKDFIISALSGLLLALFSFIILQTVNPELVSLGALNVQSVQEIDPHTYEPTYSESSGTGTTGTGSTGTVPQVEEASDLTEQQIRDELSESGIGVWESTAGATRVEGLPDTSIDYITDVTESLGGSSTNQVATLTGATEEGYHSDRHGWGQNTFDLDRPDSDLDSYVSSNSDATQDLSWGTAYYLDETIDGTQQTAMWVNEGNHWHVEIHDLGYRDQ